MPVDPSKKDEVIAKLISQYEGSINKGSSLDTPDRISTGSLELDVATSGGIPLGRWTRFYGTFSSTKTRTAWAVIREAQEMGLECVYYNVEKQFEPLSVADTGVDIDALEIVDAPTIEEYGVKLESMLGVAHLHVIDSCSNAISTDELDADADEWRPGISARAWKKVLLRAHRYFDYNENTVVLVDQMSQTFGGKKKLGGGTPMEPKGGSFPGFLSSLSLNFSKGQWLWYDKYGYLTSDESRMVKTKHLSDQDEPDGIEIKVRVDKSRVCRPRRAAVMHFDDANFEYDREWEYVKAAKFYGVVEQAGSWYTYKPESGKPDKRQGEVGIRRIIEDHDLYDEIHERAMESA